MFETDFLKTFRTFYRNKTWGDAEHDGKLENIGFEGC